MIFSYGRAKTIEADMRGTRPKEFFLRLTSAVFVLNPQKTFFQTSAEHKIRFVPVYAVFIWLRTRRK